MRIRRTVKNSLYSAVCYLLIAVLSLVVRKLFVSRIDIGLLGYEGLFSNIFAVLSIADMGIESIILYRLFPAFANNDEQEINRIMSMYRLLYLTIGAVVLTVGLAIIPFLKYLVKGNSLDWTYVYIIYLIQLALTLLTYFLAYRRLLFVVSQQEYVVTRIETEFAIVTHFLKLFALICFRSYILYLLANLAKNFVSNVVIAVKAKKRFPFYDARRKTCKEEIRQIGVGKDVKNNLVQRICLTIYGGTDNILISSLIGIDTVGFVSNYLLVKSFVSPFFTKLLSPFQASIGNYIYSNDKEKGYELFRMFDLISFFLAVAIASCYLCVFNPFITIWLGSKFQLGVVFVVAFAVNEFIAWNHQFLTFYRYSFGRYDLDRNPMIIAALLNIAVSILLAKPLGVGGIMIGTAISHVGIWIGRVNVVYTEYITEGKVRYFMRQIGRILLCIIEVGFAYYVCSKMSVTVLGIALRIVFCIIFTAGVNLVVFCRTTEMKIMIEYFRKTMNELFHHKEKGNA